MILLFNFFKEEIRRNWFGVGGFFSDGDKELGLGCRR